MFDFQIRTEKQEEDYDESENVLTRYLLGSVVWAKGWISLASFIHFKDFNEVLIGVLVHM